MCAALGYRQRCRNLFAGSVYFPRCVLHLLLTQNCFRITCRQQASQPASKPANRPSDHPPCVHSHARMRVCVFVSTLWLDFTFLRILFCSAHSSQQLCRHMTEYTRAQASEFRKHIHTYYYHEFIHMCTWTYVLTWLLLCAMSAA